jgi:ADP-ribose pyrophosphatase
MLAAMALISSDRRYTGRVINLDVDQVRFPDGAIGPLEMIRHPGASAVVPFLDPPRAADPRVVMIRQFRHAADGPVWEIPAGRLEPGEAPEQCARRELAEEAGYEAEELRALTTIFTTPGFTDERIHLFLAGVLREVPAHREWDEFVEVHALPWSGIMDMVGRREIVDAKTLVTLMFVQCFVRQP